MKQKLFFISLALIASIAIASSICDELSPICGATQYDLYLREKGIDSSHLYSLAALMYCKQKELGSHSLPSSLPLKWQG